MRLGGPRGADPEQATYDHCGGYGAKRSCVWGSCLAITVPKSVAGMGVVAGGGC